MVEYVFSAISALKTGWLSDTVGIVGCGHVGGLLYKRLRALGVSCRCYDPFLAPHTNPDLTELENIFSCDIICLHTPYTTGGPFPSHHLFNADSLASIASKAVLINAGRGGVIDNMALLNLLQQRQDLLCVLDVWEHEPKINATLLQRVDIATPHIAGHSIDGKMLGTAMVYDSLCRFFDLPSTVTLAQLDKAAEPADITIKTDSLEQHPFKL